MRTFISGRSTRIASSRPAAFEFIGAVTSPSNRSTVMPLLNDRQRLVGVAGGRQIIAVPAQHFGQHHAQQNIRLDEQHSWAAELRVSNRGGAVHIIVREIVRTILFAATRFNNPGRSVCAVYWNPELELRSTVIHMFPALWERGPDPDSAPRIAVVVRELFVAVHWKGTTGERASGLSARTEEEEGDRPGGRG